MKKLIKYFTAIVIAMLGLTLINQYACLRILCQTFKEVTMKEYTKKIIVPCLALTVASLVLPILACVLFRPTLWRLLLTGGLSLVSVLASTAFFLNKEEKQLTKSMANTVLKRLHIIKR